MLLQWPSSCAEAASTPCRDSSAEWLQNVSLAPCLFSSPQEALTRGGFNPLSANQATAAQITGLLKQQWGVTPGITCNSG